MTKKKSVSQRTRIGNKSTENVRSKPTVHAVSEPKIVVSAKDADAILDTQFARLKRYLLRTFGPGKAVYRGLLIANTFTDDGVDPAMLRK